ncbi:Ribosome production factor 1 [Lamellibrachia satsuma]|nr:Ribosome production factor 1 [Lamellibrachia satsuma]
MEAPEETEMQLAPVEMPRPNISSIKNKQRRTEAYRQMKREQRKLKNKEKKKKKKEAEMLGDKAPPKQVPKTIENMRVYDETMVAPEDEEVRKDEMEDEIAPYFKREVTPKVLITTTDRPSNRTNKFCKELKKCIPNSSIYYRRGLPLKKIVPQAVSRDYTCLLVINEDRNKPIVLVTTLDNAAGDQCYIVTTLDNAAGDQSYMVTTLDNAAGDQGYMVTTLDNAAGDQGYIVTTLDNAAGD